MPINRMNQPVTNNAIVLIENRWKVTCGSFATSGHVTNSDHYKGLAIDAMTSDLATGNAIAAWALAHPDMKYVIWQRRFNDGGGWTPYSGTSPHTDHVHISFNGTGPAGVAFKAIKGATKGAKGALQGGATPNPLESITGALQGGLALGGGIALLIGLALAVALFLIARQLSS